MSQRFVYFFAIFIIAMMANNATAQSPDEPVASNADWTPVEKEFDGVTMVLVPVGCFTMGTDTLDSEKPPHEQCIPAPYWIDKTEVTQGDFARLGGQKEAPNYYSGDTLPVDSITWLEARDFCALRGGRLPSELEWEYAARGVDSLLYPWGHEWDENLLVWNHNLEQGSDKVGSEPAGASWVGALDMSGNMMEWVSTARGIFDREKRAFATEYTYPYDAGDGRETLDDDNNLIRVVRGGSWGNNSKQDFRSSYRSLYYSPDNWNSNRGFRCARDFAPEDLN